MSRGDSWIFRHACGCAFGLVDVNRFAPNEDKVWSAIYDTAAEQRDAVRRGVTVTREAWEDYSAAGVYEQLSGRWVCPHKSAEVAS